MARSPTLDDDDARRTRRLRLGRAGLDSLMRDERYWDGVHPDHGALVDLVRRGFELVFNGASAQPDRRERPPFATPPIAPPMREPARQPPEDTFAESLARLAQHVDGLDELPPRERESLGRGAILDVLRRRGHRLPPGFDEDGPKAPFGRRPLSAHGHSLPPTRPRDAEAAQAGGAGGQVEAESDALLAVPGYRAAVFAGGARRDEWAAMHRASMRATEGSVPRTRALMEIFAAEGGLKRDPDSTAFGGILKRTLADIKKREPSLREVESPDELDTPEKMATAYRGYLKYTMNRYGGPQMLDTLEEPETAATVADTLFRHGHRDGAVIIRDAVAEVMKGIPPEKQKEMALRPLQEARDTFHNLQRLDGEAVRNAITEIRLDLVSENERERIEHFRFPRRPGSR